MNRPNRKHSFDASPIGRGFITRKFPEAFWQLLTSKYNEGTPFGTFYNELTDEGISKIYVEQPKIEKILTTIIDAESDSLKYLVGLTGIGKTTLIKNLFRTLSRKIEIYDKKIIIYISFQSANITSSNNDLISHIAGYLKLAVKSLCERFPTLTEHVNILDFKKLLAEDIRANKASVLEVDKILLNETGGIHFTSDIDQLTLLEEKKPLSYYSFLLKFLLLHCMDIDRCIFIYDDIEAQLTQVQKEIITHANHIHSCFQTELERHVYTKTIISLKSFTFREHIDREMIARRNLIENDVILKDSIPELHDIFIKRLAYAKGYYNAKIDTDSISDWEEATRILDILCSDLSLKFGKMICRLTNNNIVQSLDSFMRILTNHRYIALREAGNEGAFKIQVENYNITSAEPVLKALALGESDIFVQHDSSPFCNILTVHEEEMPNCELLGLYIIQYFITAREYGENTIYGTKYERGEDVVKKIASLFDSQGEKYVTDLKERLTYMMSFLFTGRVLSRSIFDYEDIRQSIPETTQRYFSDYGLYLSWRGVELFEQLSQSSMLFELFRDDIDTNLHNNDRSSSRMTTTDCLLYLLEYTKILFNQIEKDYIHKAYRYLNTYQKYFGETFITCFLLEGIARSMDRFYKTRDNEYGLIKTRVIDIARGMLVYSKMLEDETGVRISVTDYLSKLL